tara:strand:- start:13570 stop:14637 length:1068 start_codon:yes stop_codon:yes gene_type:complete
MFQSKRYLQKISRVRIPENRDLINGLRLDRNEKVSDWEKNIFQKIFNKLPSYFLSIYPDHSSIYRKISKFDKVNEENILITSGIDGGIKSIFECAINPGDTVGVVYPTYAMYQVYSKIFNVKLFKIDYTENLKFNFKKFDIFLKKNPKVFFLPNPNQPIESCFQLKDLEKIAKKLKKINCIFFIDEAYFLFGSKSAVKIFKKYNNIIVARTFSKGFGVPSIRLGYLVANKKIIDIVSKTRFAHETNSLSTTVAEYLLDNFNLVKRYNLSIIKSRLRLKKELKKIDINSFGKYGNYLLIDLRNNQDASRIVKKLKLKKIYTKGPWKGKFDKYITISLGPFPQMKKFLISLKKLLQK